MTCLRYSCYRTLLYEQTDYLQHFSVHYLNRELFIFSNKKLNQTLAAFWYNRVQTCTSEPPAACKFILKWHPFANIYFICAECLPDEDLYNCTCSNVSIYTEKTALVLCHLALAQYSSNIRNRCNFTKRPLTVCFTAYVHRKCTETEAVYVGLCWKMPKIKRILFLCNTYFTKLYIFTGTRVY